MAKLQSKHKEFIVRELATFKDPSEVIESFNDEFQKEVTPSQISYYNPENIQATRLSEKWIHMFYSTRREYLKDASKVPLFHRAYRLHEMQRNYDQAKSADNIVLAQQILEQAAKETGGYYEKGGQVKESSNDGSFYQQINAIIMAKNEKEKQA